MKLLIATRNPGKLKEIQELLGNLPCEVVSLADFPEVPEHEETGASYTENAAMKARAASEATGLWTLADDSGLEVEALGGEPGVRSRRYEGEETPFPVKMRKLLGRLQGIRGKGRKATFRCVVAVANPSAGVTVCQGECKGEIAEEMRGENGFGFDPIFFYPPFGKTFGELAPEEKNRVSHRAMAMRKAKEVILERLRNEDPSNGKDSDPKRSRGMVKQS